MYRLRSRHCCCNVSPHKSVVDSGIVKSRLRTNVKVVVAFLPANTGIDPKLRASRSCRVYFMLAPVVIPLPNRLEYEMSVVSPNSRSLVCSWFVTANPYRKFHGGFSLSLVSAVYPL